MSADPAGGRAGDGVDADAPQSTLRRGAGSGSGGTDAPKGGNRLRLSQVSANVAGPAAVAALVLVLAASSAGRRLGWRSLQWVLLATLPQIGRGRTAAGVGMLRLNALRVPVPTAVAMVLVVQHYFVTRRARQLNLTLTQLFWRRVNLVLHGLTRVGAMAQQTADAAVGFVDESTDAVSAIVASSLESRIDDSIELVADKIRDMIKDPDMPAIVRDSVDGLVDNLILPPVRSQVLRKSDELFLSPVKQRISRKARNRAAKEQAFKRKLKARRRRKANSVTSIENGVEPSETGGEEPAQLSRVVESDTSDSDSSDWEQRLAAADSGSDGDSDSGSGQLSPSSTEVSQEEEDVSKSVLARTKLRVIKSLETTAKTVREKLIQSQKQSRAYRASILYTMSPFDKSIWSCMRIPAWWGFNMIGLVPKLGQVWWMWSLVARDMKDEYQVCDFIVSFETSKFLTIGCFGLCWGAFKYWRCVSLMNYACEVAGPRLDAWDAVFFLLQILMVWYSFFLLPSSTRRGYSLHAVRHKSHRTVDTTPTAIDSPLSTQIRGRDFVTRPSSLPQQKPAMPVANASWGSLAGLAAGVGSAEELAAASTMIEPDPAPYVPQQMSRFLPSGRPEAGGPLRNMFLYHSGIVGLTILLGAVTLFLVADDGVAIATLYWIRVIYGLLSMPFAAFKIPVASQILIPVQKTGYDQRGETVLTLPPHKLVRSTKGRAVQKQAKRRKLWAQLALDATSAQSPGVFTETPFTHVQ